MATKQKKVENDKVLKEKKAAKPKAVTPKVDWSIFDSIWGISFTGYTERRKGVESELKRIGILDSGRFNWRFTFPTIFDNILFDVTKKQLKHNTCKNVSSMSCSLGHYGCIKTAYELGHEFILIMEDDIRFLKDVGRIADIIKTVPPCADIVNFDALPSDAQWNEMTYKNAVETGSYNDNFFRADGFMGGSCYALSRRAMKAICMRYEQMLAPADHYLSGLIYLGNDISRYVSKESVCCQLTYGNSVNSKLYGQDSLHVVYARKKLDYSKYNIFDVKNYNYGSAI